MEGVYGLVFKLTFSVKREDGYLIDHEIYFHNDNEMNIFIRSLKSGIFNGRKIIGIPVIERK